MAVRHSGFLSPGPASGQRAGQADVALYLGPWLLQSLRQREEERLRLCDWHLFFALIYRGRRLSARNLGPASPVEANHPQVSVLYNV
jgi:hypothetical protein